MVHFHDMHLCRMLARTRRDKVTDHLAERLRLIAIPSHEFNDAFHQDSERFEGKRGAGIDNSVICKSLDGWFAT